MSEWSTRVSKCQTPNGGIAYQEHFWDVEPRGFGTTPKAKVILFVHGYLDSFKTWSRLHSVLQKMWSDDGSKKKSVPVKLVSISLRGWGDSDKKGPYTIDSYTDDVIDVLKFVGGADVYCGHSMGTLIGTAVQCRDTDLVRQGYVLFGAAAKMDPAHYVDKETTLGDIGQLVNAWSDTEPPTGDALEFLESFQLDDLKPYIEKGSCPQDFPTQVMAETLKADPRAYKEAWASMIKEDHTGDIKKQQTTAWSKVKVVLVSGSGDVVFPEAEQKRLVDCVGTGAVTSTVTVPGAPHGCIWTDPEICAKAVFHFIS